ncbi:unnamed protein product, partial [marine sediment metagenome]
LRLRKDVAIEAGKASIRATAKAAKDLRFSGGLEVRDLAASRGDQRIAMDAPITASLAGTIHPAEGLEVENLSVESSFMRLDGSGNMTGAQAKAVIDLDALTREAGKFIDLGNKEVHGTAEFSLTASQAKKESEVDFKASADLKEIILSGIAAQTISESSLSMEATGTGVLSEGRIRAIRDLNTKLTTDWLQSSLSVTRVDFRGERPTLIGLRARVQGELNDASSDLLAVLGLPVSAGSFFAEMEAALDKEALKFEKLFARADGLEFHRG